MAYPCQSFDTTIFCSEGNTKRWKKFKKELLDLSIKILAVVMNISYRKKNTHTQTNKQKTVYQVYTLETVLE